MAIEWNILPQFAISSPRDTENYIKSWKMDANMFEPHPAYKGLYSFLKKSF